MMIKTIKNRPRPGSNSRPRLDPFIYLREWLGGMPLPVKNPATQDHGIVLKLRAVDQLPHSLLVLQAWTCQ
jgi:hypothetical protein